MILSTIYLIYIYPGVEPVMATVVSRCEGSQGSILHFRQNTQYRHLSRLDRFSLDPEKCMMYVFLAPSK